MCTLRPPRRKIVPAAASSAGDRPPLGEVTAPTRLAGDVAAAPAPASFTSAAVAAASEGTDAVVLAAATSAGLGGGFLPQTAKRELFCLFRSRSATLRSASSRSTSSSRACVSRRGWVGEKKN